jgi:ribose transport system substrate-binding protein
MSSVRFFFRPLFLLAAFGALPCFGEAPVKIGALLKGRAPGFWQHVERGMNETAEKLGVTIIVKAPPHALDVGAQFRLLTALEKENIDVLILAATNPDQFDAPVAALKAKGVKVVTLDTALSEGLAHVFVGADQGAMAEEAVRSFAKLIRDGDEVALLRNNTVDRTVVEREKKFFEVMKASGTQMKLHAEFYSGSAKNNEETQARLLLETHPETKAAFASASNGTLALLRVALEKNLAGKIKVFGFGTYLPDEAVAGFETKLLWGWVAQQPKDSGRKAVEAAVALARGKQTAAVVRPVHKLVTPENFRDADVQALRTP